MPDRPRCLGLLLAVLLLRSAHASRDPAEPLADHLDDQAWAEAPPEALAQDTSSEIVANKSTSNMMSSEVVMGAKWTPANLMSQAGASGTADGSDLAEVFQDALAAAIGEPPANASSKAKQLISQMYQAIQKGDKVQAQKLAMEVEKEVHMVNLQENKTGKPKAADVEKLYTAIKHWDEQRHHGKVGNTTQAAAGASAASDDAAATVEDTTTAAPQSPAAAADHQPTGDTSSKAAVGAPATSDDDAVIAEDTTAEVKQSTAGAPARQPIADTSSEAAAGTSSASDAAAIAEDTTTEVPQSPTDAVDPKLNADTSSKAVVGAPVASDDAAVTEETTTEVPQSPTGAADPQRTADSSSKAAAGAPAASPDAAGAQDTATGGPLSPAAATDHQPAADTSSAVAGAAVASDDAAIAEDTTTEGPLSPTGAVDHQPIADSSSKAAAGGPAADDDAAVAEDTTSEVTQSSAADHQPTADTSSKAAVAAAAPQGDAVAAEDTTTAVPQSPTAAADHQPTADTSSKAAGAATAAQGDAAAAEAATTPAPREDAAPTEGGTSTPPEPAPLSATKQGSKEEEAATTPAPREEAAPTEGETSTPPEPAPLSATKQGSKEEEAGGQASAPGNVTLEHTDQGTPTAASTPPGGAAGQPATDAGKEVNHGSKAAHVGLSEDLARLEKALQSGATSEALELATHFEDDLTLEEVASEDIILETDRVVSNLFIGNLDGARTSLEKVKQLMAKATADGWVYARLRPSPRHSAPQDQADLQESLLELSSVVNGVPAKPEAIHIDKALSKPGEVIMVEGQEASRKFDVPADPGEVAWAADHQANHTAAVPKNTGEVVRAEPQTVLAALPGATADQDTEESSSKDAGVEAEAPAEASGAEEQHGANPEEAKKEIQKLVEAIGYGALTMAKKLIEDLKLHIPGIEGHEKVAKLFDAVSNNQIGPARELANQVVFTMMQLADQAPAGQVKEHVQGDDDAPPPAGANPSADAKEHVQGDADTAPPVVAISPGAAKEHVQGDEDTAPPAAAIPSAVAKEQVGQVEQNKLEESDAATSSFKGVDINHLSQEAHESLQLLDDAMKRGDMKAVRRLGEKSRVIMALKTLQDSNYSSKQPQDGSGDAGESGKVASDSPGTMKDCSVNVTGNAEEVLQQLRACTDKLGEFAKVVEGGEQQSKKNNNALRDELQQVGRLFAKLSDRRPVDAAFNKDQQQAAQFLLGELNKADTEIAKMKAEK